MRLAIIGNQALSRRQGELAWWLIQGLLRTWEPQEVWSGGATGVDSVAEECAYALGYEEEVPRGHKRLVICRPDVHQWDPVGRRGYKARNLEIVNGVDRLVRISKHQDGGGTYGSGWTANQAEERLGSENVFRYYI